MSLSPVSAGGPPLATCSAIWGGFEMIFRGRDAAPVCGGLHRPRESHQCNGGSDREGKTTARPPGGVDG